MTRQYTKMFTKLGLSPEEFKDNVVVITGAGRGIGKQAAGAFASLGAKVVIAELSDTGSQVAAEIQGSGGDASFIQTDVSRAEDVATLVEETLTIYGKADVLINNAILCPTASVLEMDLATWDRVMAVNLRGTFLTCKAFLPGMLAQGKGTIINMISTDAMPYLSAYIASKQGIAAFSQSLAGEVGEQGIRVVAFAPGFVDTPGLRDAAEGLAPHMGISPEQFLGLSMHPAYPAAMPVQDAAAAAVFLVVRLAGEYHGEQVNGYTILERAGYLVADTAAEEIHLGENETIPDDKNKNSHILALEACRQLQNILVESEAEFNKLPVFVRPMARKGFKDKSGMNVKEWHEVVEKLIRTLQTLQAAGKREDSMPLSSPSLPDNLEKLITYYRDTPRETARFTKDAVLLQQIQQTADARVAVIQRLIQNLNRLDG